MATVLESLVATLSLDSAGMAKGAQDAQNSLDGLSKSTTDAGTAAQKAGTDGAEAFAAFRQEAVGALALFTGGKSLMGFTQDITDATTALGSLSQQLDIAPAKLTQLHHVAKSAGVDPGDVDSLFHTLHHASTDPKKTDMLGTASQKLGVTLLDDTQRVRSDLIEQLHASPAFRRMSRSAQEDTLAPIGGKPGIAALAMRDDIPQRMARYAPTEAQQNPAAQSYHVQNDWAALKANTHHGAQASLNELEPSLHNFSRALEALENTHPDALSHTIEGVAAGLKALSAVMTARGVLSALKGQGPTPEGASLPIMARDEALAHRGPPTTPKATTPTDRTSQRADAPSSLSQETHSLWNRYNNVPHHEEGAHSGAPHTAHPHHPAQTRHMGRPLPQILPEGGPSQPTTPHEGPIKTPPHGAPHLGQHGAEQLMAALSPRLNTAVMHAIRAVKAPPHEAQSHMLTHVAGLSHAVSSAPVHHTSHTTTNTTHAPVMNITVHGNDNPHETAQVIEQRIAESLHAANLHQVI